jgi:flagellar motor switch protein FliN/FliY
MSDGALSQAEIDALLGGGSAPAAGGAAAAPAGPSSLGGAADTLKGFFSGTTGTLSASISAMTGKTAKLSLADSDAENRDDMLAKLPDTVTAVKIDYNAGFPGEHSFIMPEETAQALFAAMNQEPNAALDEMAMSTLGELVSTMTGGQLTALQAKTGMSGISNIPPEAHNVPKATAELPAGDFVCQTYNLDLGDGKQLTLYEVFGEKAASSIAGALNEAAQPTIPAGGASASAPAAANSAIMPGGMSNFGPAPNVQGVQFPGLNPAPLTAKEQGNIGLLMDVYMEMTVELGRTRKLIKDILAMGEGTIIELDKLAGEPVDILVNHKLIAKGEVVVIDENFGVRVTAIVSPSERVQQESH